MNPSSASGPTGSPDGLDHIRERLDTIAEELADAALDQLREAMEGSEEELAAGKAAERRITRARRAVEKASALLRDDGTTIHLD